VALLEKLVDWVRNGLFEAASSSLLAFLLLVSGRNGHNNTASVADRETRSMRSILRESQPGAPINKYSVAVENVSARTRRASGTSLPRRRKLPPFNSPSQRYLASLALGPPLPISIGEDETQSHKLSPRPTLYSVQLLLLLGDWYQI
jgi:hypothetical protein